MKNLFFSENRLIGFSQETNPQPKILKPDPFEDKKEKVDGKAETKEAAEAPDRSKEINETVTKLGVKLEKMKAMATKMPPELAEKWETFVNARITEINVNANVDQEAAMKAIEKCSQELEKVLSHETASVEVVRNGESVTVTAPSIPGKIPTNFCVVGGIPQSASITADGRQQWTVPSVLPTATATVTYMDCKTGALMQIPIFIGKSGSMKLDAINPAQAKVKTTPMPSAYGLAMPKAEENVEPAPTKTTEKAPEADKNADIKGAMDQLEFFLGAHEFDDNARSALVRLNAALSARTNPDEKVAALISVGLLKESIGDDGRKLRTPIMKVMKNPSSNINYEIGTNMNGDSVWVEEVKEAEVKKEKPKLTLSQERVQALNELSQKAEQYIQNIRNMVTADGKLNMTKARQEIAGLNTLIRDAATTGINNSLLRSVEKNPISANGTAYVLQFDKENMKFWLTEDVPLFEPPAVAKVKNPSNGQQTINTPKAAQVIPPSPAAPSQTSQAPKPTIATKPTAAPNTGNTPKATPTSTATPESPAAEPVGPAAKKDLAKKTDALKKDAEEKAEKLKEAPGTKGEALERQMDSALKKLGEAKTDTQKFAAFMELLATIIEFIRAAFKGELSQEYNKDGQKGKESKEKEKSKDAYARVAKEVGENKEKKPLTEKLKDLETKKETDLAKTKLDLTKNENDTKTLKEKGVTLGNQKTVLDGELKKIDSKDPKAAEERTRLTAEIQKLTDLMKSNREAVVASEKRHAELVKKKTELIEDGMVLREMNEKVGKALGTLKAGLDTLKATKTSFVDYSLQMSPEGGIVVSFEDATAGFTQEVEKVGGKLQSNGMLEIDSEKLASMQALAGKPAGSPNPAERPEDKIEPPKNPESLDMGEIAKVLKDTFSVLNGKIERTQANLKDADKDLKEAQASWNMFRKSWFSDEVKAKQADVDQSKAALAKLNQHKARISPFFDEKGEARQNITKDQLEAISDVRTKLGLPALPRNMVADYDAFQKEALAKFAGRDKKLEVNYQEINEMLKQTDAFLGNIETGIRTVDTAAAIGSSFAGPWGSFVYSGIRNMGDYVSGAKTAEQALFDTALMVVAGKLGGSVAGGAGKLVPPSVRNAVAVWAQKNAPMLTKGVAKTIVEYGGKATTGGIAGGTMAGFDAGTRNAWAYSKGEKTGEQAFEDTYNSAKTGVVTGAVLGGTLPAVGKAWNKGKAWRAEAKAAKANNADPSKAPGFKIQGEAPPPAGSVKVEAPISSATPSPVRKGNTLEMSTGEKVSAKRVDANSHKISAKIDGKKTELTPREWQEMRKSGKIPDSVRDRMNPKTDSNTMSPEKSKSFAKVRNAVARVKSAFSRKSENGTPNTEVKPETTPDGTQVSTVKWRKGENLQMKTGQKIEVKGLNKDGDLLMVEIDGKAMRVNSNEFKVMRNEGVLPRRVERIVTKNNVSKSQNATKSKPAEVAKAKPAAAAQFDETVSLGTAGTLTVKELGTKGLLKVEINGKEAIMSQQEFTRAREQGKLPDRLRNFEKQIAPSAAPALKSKQAEAAEAKPAAAPTALPNQQGTSFTLGNGINLTVAVKNNPPLPLPPGNYQIKSVNPGNGTAIVFRNGSPQDLHTVNLNELNAIPKTPPPPANATSKSPSAPTKLKVPLRLEYRAALTDPSSNIQKIRISMDGYLRTETHPDTLLLKKHLPALKARSTELEKATATPDPKGGVERAGLEMERDFLRSLLPRMEKIISEKGSSYAA